VLATYFNDKTWSTGLGLDVTGGLLMVAAIARAPVSLVQPVARGAADNTPSPPPESPPPPRIHTSVVSIVTSKFTRY
jgi:hypothetical protein